MKISYIFLILIGLVVLSCSEKNENTTKNKTVINSDSVKIDSLTRLIGNNSKKATLYAERSMLFARQSQLKEAIKDLIFANNLDSLNPEYYLRLADFYLSMGKSETVNSVLLRGNRNIPGNKEILYKLGNLYFYIQDYKMAMDYLKQAINIDSYFAEAYFTMGLIYSETGNKNQAIQSFQIAVEREPEYYDAYVQLGLLYSEKHDSLALAYFDNALRIVPDSYEATYAKAMFYQENDNPDKAIAIYETMLKMNNDSLPEIYFNLGYINMIMYGEYMQAIKNYDAAIALYPKYVEALCNRAFCYEKLNSPGKARLDYMLVLDISPNYELAVTGLNRLEKK